MIVLFGYIMENGENEVNKATAEIVRQSFFDYMKSVSLKAKAEELTAAHVEYAPGKSEWNKNRVQRMLTDRRYLGTEQHPPIIDQETFDAVQRIMSERNTQKNSDRQTVFSSSVVPILCGKCGSSTERRYDRRWKNTVKHYCQNPECRAAYAMPDETLWKKTAELLPLMATADRMTPEQTEFEIERLLNEIERELQYTTVDLYSLQKKMMRCAALRYSSIAPTITESVDFSKLKPCSPIFIRELKRRVSAIELTEDGNIRLLPHGRKE